MKKLTLSVIFGNDQEVAKRFVHSFAPVVGRIVAVRAVGCATTDRTDSELSSAASALGIEIIFKEYKNAPTAADWPHVDNFSAARQMSWDAACATGAPYVLWADLDDLWEGDSEAVLREVEEGKFDMLLIPYDVQRGLQVIHRERIIRNDGGAYWVNPVHEKFAFKKNSTYHILSNCKFIHAPTADGKDKRSHDRNTRILTHSIAQAATSFFYLHKEAFELGKKDEANRWGRAALTTPGLEKVDRYEILLNLAQSCEDPYRAKELASSAFSVLPDRREALALLATFKMIDGENLDAHRLAKIMMSIPLPDLTYSFLNREWYGWKGESLYTQTLRRIGRGDSALKFEAQNFRQNGSKISLLHATRGRVMKAIQCRETWLSLASNADQIEHIFAIDEDDEITEKTLRGFRHVIVPKGGGCVAAWNAAAKECSGKILVQLSDDWLPIQAWDETIIKSIGDLEKPAVLAISDGYRKDNLLCMAILTRKRFEDQGGVLFHPSFKSVYSDNWFTDCAYRDGVVVEARDLVFWHKNPYFTTGKFDSDTTYAESNSGERYRTGMIAYMKLKSGMEK